LFTHTALHYRSVSDYVNNTASALYQIGIDLIFLRSRALAILVLHDKFKTTVITLSGAQGIYAIKPAPRYQFVFIALASMECGCQ
tara:strand:- start:72 stop:326 length:255 start_codon:yes stop_codon:yes gene_type:complete